MQHPFKRLRSQRVKSRDVSGPNYNLAPAEGGGSGVIYYGGEYTSLNK